MVVRQIGGVMDLTKTWCIYGMVVPSDPWVFIKIGKTQRIEHRLTAVQCGCPLPIEYVMSGTGLEAKQANDAERAMHGLLAEFRQKGEWFQFNLDSKEHKKRLNDAFTQVFTRIHGPSWQLKVQPVEDARKAGEQYSADRRQVIENAFNREETERLKQIMKRAAKGLMPEFWNE